MEIYLWADNLQFSQNEKIYQEGEGQEQQTH